MSKARKAVVLDRDGVVLQGGITDRAAEVKIMPGAGAALQSLRDAGFLLILATNQGGLGEDLDGNVIWDKARLDRRHLAEIHDRMHELLGLEFDVIKFCPHAYWDPRGDCTCHKPKPGMIDEALKELGVSPVHAAMIGDKATDLLAARSAGITEHYLMKSREYPDEAEKFSGEMFVVSSLPLAAAMIIALDESDD